MNTKTLVIIAFFAFVSMAFMPLQTEQSYFVQFKITTVSSNDQAMVIDQKMKSKSGIMISRTDYITSTYFCVLKPGIDYNQENFENWFSKLGYEISCFNKGIQSVDKSISPHILKNCQDEK